MESLSHVGISLGSQLVSSESFTTKLMTKDSLPQLYKLKIGNDLIV